MFDRVDSSSDANVCTIGVIVSSSLDAAGIDRDKMQADDAVAKDLMGNTLSGMMTQVVEEKPKTIITRYDSPDVGFDQSINPYRGCEHGCSYCYARPAHAYIDLDRKSTRLNSSH